MTKYFEALKEYNKGKDKWCMPRKGTHDYKIIKNIIEKNKSSKLSPKEPKISKVPKEPKEPKISKVPKEPKEPKISKVPKEPKEPKIHKVPKEPKEPKVQKNHKVKVHKEQKVSDPKISMNNNIINFPISMKLLSNKKYSKYSIKSNQKRSSVFIEKVHNKQNANIIANFLKNKLIKDKYTLNNRIAFYKYIKNLLVDINGDECLESKVFKSRKGYTINNKINLYKKIGTESAFGVIYLTSIVNSFGGFTIASKVMPNNEDNANEIKIMTFLRDKVLLKNRSKHFVFMYKHVICNKRLFDDKHRIVCVNELAHGDLKMLMENEEILKDDELIMNLLFQTFISIGTFHNIVGHVHRDTHHGNFLYQKNNDKGYYEYSFNGKSYYLKSCGYNIMIYDFGLSEEINQNGDLVDVEYIPEDYQRIARAFFNKRDEGWIKHKFLPSDYISETIITNILELEDIEKIYIDRNDFFKKIIEKIFIKSSPTGMWITVRPNNVINKIAFDIS